MFPTSGMPQSAQPVAPELTRRGFAPSPRRCVSARQSPGTQIAGFPSLGECNRISYVPPPHCVARMASYTPLGSATDLNRRSFVPPMPTFRPSVDSSAPQIQPATSHPVEAPAASADLHHDIADKMLEPWLEPEVVQARRSSMGVDVPEVSEFLSKCEVISLGNFCGIARALQAIDVKKKAYPFDWVRSPVDGVIRCFETDFEDFLTFSMVRDDEASKLKVFTGSRWGGAFWHHNPLDPKTKTDFTRRIERLLGLGDIPSSKPRFFVRAVNSTSELQSTLRLHETLQRALPDTTIYLLILIDFQLSSGLVRLDGNIGANILFYRVQEAVFATLPWSMQRVSEAYAEAVVSAARYWSGGDKALTAVKSVSSLSELGRICDEFDGGNPGSDGFWPRRFQGQRISVRSASRLPGLLAPASASALASASASASAPMAQPEAQEQVAEVRIPEGYVPGDALNAHAFGGNVQLQVPLGACVGQTLKLKLMEGVVTVIVAAAMNAATVSDTGRGSKSEAVARA